MPWPGASACAERKARGPNVISHTVFANVSEPGPLRGLNFAMQIDWTMGNAMPRPDSSACAEHEARG